ncbi:MAG: NAD-dependent epimerase/dehydratase family protein [Planctomycetaceae bacterium]
MSAFVTGATGFLGRRLVRALREDGMPVRCYVRLSSDVQELRDFVGESLWEGVEVVRGELTDSVACRDALHGCRVVYHLAAALSGGTASLFLNTVVATRCLMNAALEQDIARFVLVSSFGVYGAALLKRGSLLDETTPVEPEPHRRDPYTYSKVIQEQAAWEAYRQQGLPLVVIRPGVIYGDERGVLSGRVGLKLGNLMIRMGGSQPVPYTYVDNCARAILQAGIVPGIEGEAFNIIDDKLPTASQVLKGFRRAGGKIRGLWIPGPVIGMLSSMYDWYHRFSKGQLPGAITRYKSANQWKRLQYSNAKAKSRLGWTPQVSFEEALTRSRVRTK